MWPRCIVGLFKSVFIPQRNHLTVHVSKHMLILECCMIAEGAPGWRQYLRVRGVSPYSSQGSYIKTSRSLEELLSGLGDTQPPGPHDWTFPVTSDLGAQPLHGLLAESHNHVEVWKEMSRLHLESQYEKVLITVTGSATHMPSSLRQYLNFQFRD